MKSLCDWFKLWIFAI